MEFSLVRNFDFGTKPLRALLVDAAWRARSIDCTLYTVFYFCTVD
jgi:hypothetical protein